METLWKIVDNFASVLAETGLWLAIGFAIAGVLHAFVPRSLIERHLRGRGVWPVIKATVVGIPVPLCSCSVIPTVAALRRRGASRGASAAFAISSPEVDGPSVMVTWGLLGPALAIARPIAAMCSAVTAGLLINRFAGPDEGVVDEGVGTARTGECATAGASCCDARGASAGTCCGGAACGCRSGDGACGCGQAEGVRGDSVGGAEAQSIASLAAGTWAKASGEHSVAASALAEPAAWATAKHQSPTDARSTRGGACCSGTSAAAHSCCGTAPTTAESCCSGASNDAGRGTPGSRSLGASLVEAARYGFLALPRMLAPWLLVGLALSALVSTFLPPDALRTVGGGIGAMLLALVIGLPIYVCATASTPLAASLVAAGLSPAAALVFLLAGPATNTTTMVWVLRDLGRRALAVYLVTIGGVALAAGLVFEALGLTARLGSGATSHAGHGLLPPNVSLIVGGLLLGAGLVGWAWPKRGSAAH